MTRARELRAGRGFARFGQPVLVNGAAGVMVRTPGGPLAVAGLTIVKGRIAAIDIVGDPAKLAGIPMD